MPKPAHPDVGDMLSPPPRPTKLRPSSVTKPSSLISRRDSFTSFATAASVRDRGDPTSPTSSSAGQSASQAPDSSASELGRDEGGEEGQEEEDDSSLSEGPPPHFKVERKTSDNSQKSPATSQAGSVATFKDSPKNSPSRKSPGLARDFLISAKSPAERRIRDSAVSSSPYSQSDFDPEEFKNRIRANSRLTAPKSTSNLRDSRISSGRGSRLLLEAFDDRRSSRITDASRDSFLAPRSRSTSRLSRRSDAPASRLTLNPRPSMSSLRSADIYPVSPTRSRGSFSARYDPREDGASTIGGRSRRPSISLDEAKVFPGTKIRKYTEPPLTETMSSVMAQFSGRNMADHRCAGYPIAVFAGATAIDTGSIIHPHISGGLALYFGPGHPKNMAINLPEEDRVPKHIPNPKAPTTIALSRRAELRAVISALETIYDLYRGRACAHICIDSAYVAKAWGTWIPTWEVEGWPGEEPPEPLRRSSRKRSSSHYGGGYASEDGRSYGRAYRSRTSHRGDYLDEDPYERGYRSDYRRGGSERGGNSRRDRRRHSFSDSEDYSDDYDDRRSAYGSSRSARVGGGRRDRYRPPKPSLRKLVDEDLLRELADIRFEFAEVERNRIGSAHLYLIDRMHNPADKMARAVARSENSFLNGNATRGEEEDEVEEDDEDEDEDEERHDEKGYFSEDREETDDGKEQWYDGRSRIDSRSSSRQEDSRRGGRGPPTRARVQKLSARRLRELEEEQDLQAETQSIRSVRTAKSDKSRKSRRDRDKDQNLARELDHEYERMRAVSSRGAPPTSSGFLSPTPRRSLSGPSRSQPNFRSAYADSAVDFSDYGRRDGRRSRLRPAPEDEDYHDGTRNRSNKKVDEDLKRRERKKIERERMERERASKDDDNRSFFSKMFGGRRGKKTNSNSQR
ncbi:hypothetical protein IE53DRAFT_386919 [Violaceomyces palustris]|uniref:Uncharacterized protein n=1 Tax=Violaceomyces palustris TaxID=1673888 RepID=A0ACD0NY60_9BASI|nr:hypothetical protein IE53DRAFT_386919 [Violaceomyces palustris]